MGLFIHFGSGFEKLNGIMGSYHTNNRNISIQLMRRFLDCSIYAPRNWPQEFAADFIPLLEKFCYNQGSLKQSSIGDNSPSVTSLPPVYECSLDPQQLLDVQSALDVLFQLEKVTPLLLYKRAKALQVGDILMGSRGPRFFRSSIVFAQRLDSNEICLTEVQFYACISVVKQSSSSTEIIWLAFVSWYETHPCCVWFGSPVEVWSTSSIQSQFIPISNIKSCSVYVKASVKFGRIVGTQTVIVATPIEG